MPPLDVNMSYFSTLGIVCHIYSLVPIAAPRAGTYKPREINNDLLAMCNPKVYILATAMRLHEDLINIIIGSTT